MQMRLGDPQSWGCRERGYAAGLRGCFAFPGSYFLICQVEVGEALGHLSNLCYQTLSVAAIYPVL